MKIIPKKISGSESDITYGFLIFTSALCCILFLIGGYDLFSSFLSAVFIYVFLRFSNFLWNIILKILKRIGGGGTDAGA